MRGGAAEPMTGEMGAAHDLPLLKRWRIGLVLLLVSAYLVAEHGFMLVRIPPSGSVGVPLAEITVALFAMMLLSDLPQLKRFAAIAPITPLLIWWGLGFFRMALGLYENGIWAIRDASHLIDSLFLWVGFVIAATPHFLERFSSWLRVTLNVAIVYGLLYPLRETLAQWSPKITAPGGYVAPLLFNYGSGALPLITGAARVLIDHARLLRLPPSLLAGFLLAFTVAIFQQRIGYLQIIALMGLLMIYEPRSVKQIAGGLIAAFALLLLILQTGIEIPGRLGQPFSFEFLWNHFEAIWGADSGGAVSGAASGTGQRIEWWSKIWADVTSSPGTLLFGLGYGIPLTDFRYIGDVLVREPHNSTVSVFARLGLVGLIAYAWIHVALARRWLFAVRRLGEEGDMLWRANLLIMGAFILFVWILTFGEDGLEKPFNAVPFYLFWGIILRVASALRRTPSKVNP